MKHPVAFAKPAFLWVFLYGQWNRCGASLANVFVWHQFIQTAIADGLACLIDKNTIAKQADTRKKDVGIRANLLQPFWFG